MSWLWRLRWWQRLGDENYVKKGGYGGGMYDVDCVVYGILVIFGDLCHSDVGGNNDCGYWWYLLMV